MKNATKKAAKKKEGGRGRPSAFAGMKLYKLEATDKTPKLRAGGNREGYFKMISNGMKFETYAEKGGSVADLVVLIDYKLVEARAE